MNASVNLKLDKRYQKRDGSHSIKLLIVIDGKVLRLSTGFSVEAKYWLEKSQSIRTSCKAFQNVSRINNLLHRRKSDILDILIQLQDEGKHEHLSLNDIKTQITGGKDTVYTYEFCAQIIDELEGVGKVGNARVTICCC